MYMYTIDKPYSPQELKILKLCLPHLAQLPPSLSTCIMWLLRTNHFHVNQQYLSLEDTHGQQGQEQSHQEWRKYSTWFAKARNGTACIDAPDGDSAPDWSSADCPAEERRVAPRSKVGSGSGPLCVPVGWQPCRAAVVMYTS